MTQQIQVFSLNENGLVPGPRAIQQLFLRDDGTWQTIPPAGAAIPDAPVDGTYYGRQNATWQRVLPEAPNDGFVYSRQSLAWVKAAVQSDAPADSTEYGRNNNAWTRVAIQSDAPSDSTPYVRQNAAWIHAPTFTTTTNGLVPTPNAASTGKVLTDAGTWVDNSNPFTTTLNGMVPHPGSAVGKVLSDAGTWVANGAAANVRSLYDVVTYGADPTGTNDSASAIQSAITAATTAGGGIIYFPTGNYKINSAITFSATDNSGLRLMGAGSLNQFGGSRITATGQFYAFYCHNTTGQGGNQPVASIEHLTITNQFNPGAHGTITNTEVSGGGYGCIYMTAGIGVRFESLSLFLTTGGIAMFLNGISPKISQINIGGGYSGTHAEDSYGIITNDGFISGGRIDTVGYGIVGAGSSPSCIVQDLDMELCGCTILTGGCPIPVWDPFQQPNGHLTSAPGASGTQWTIRHIGTESCGDTDGRSAGAIIKLIGNYITIDEVNCANFVSISPRALWLNSAFFVSVNAFLCNDNGGAGQFSTAAIDFTVCATVDFKNCNPVTNTTGSKNWNLPTTNAIWNNNFTAGITWEKCNSDGAIPFAALPIPPLAGAKMMITDSVDPAWTGSASNSGKPITGGGSYRLMARSNGGQLNASASWTTSNNTITFASNLPNWVTAGMLIQDATTLLPVGTVSSGAGTTTLHLTANASNASAGSADLLVFYQWVIS